MLIGRILNAQMNGYKKIYRNMIKKIIKRFTHRKPNKKSRFSIGFNFLMNSFIKKWYEIILLFIVFLSVIITYNFVSWIKYQTFTSSQIEEFILNEVEFSDKYDLNKYLLDIKWYGNKDLILTLESLPSKNESIETLWNNRNKIYVFSEFQKNPIHKMLFSNTFYKKEYEVFFNRNIEVNNISVISNNYTQDNIILEMRDRKNNNSLNYWILTYEFGDYKIYPLLSKYHGYKINEDLKEIIWLQCKDPRWILDSSRCYNLFEEQEYEVILNWKEDTILLSSFLDDNFYINFLEENILDLYVKTSCEISECIWDKYHCSFESKWYQCIHKKKLDALELNNLNILINNKSKKDEMKSFNIIDELINTLWTQ